MALKISDEARVQMPMKTVASSNHPCRNWDLGFFRDPGEAQSALNSIKNDGEGFGT